MAVLDWQYKEIYQRAALPRKNKQKSAIWSSHVY